MKLKWNLNQTETSLLENITNMGESNNREKTSTKQSVICGEFFKKFMFCSTKKARFDKSTKKERNFFCNKQIIRIFKKILYSLEILTFKHYSNTVRNVAFVLHP